ncbi:MAG: hypothetical protein HQ483_18380 [Rhodospirillales bacterium]|nr:hypothetical protein [Rhodospirillales bacterium]
MTYSVVSICNLALQMLDAPAIININDDSKRARACKRAYVPARDEVTVQYEWRVARARTTLAADTAAPAFGWRYAYAWPSECIRLLRPTYGGVWNGTPIPGDMEGRYFLTEVTAPLRVWYLKYITDPSQIDPLFARAIAARIAADIGREVTGRDSYVQLAEARYDKILAQAQQTDALHDDVEEPVECAWVTGREAG